MAVCKQKENRAVPIQHKKSDGTLFEPSERFGLFFLNSGLIILELNGKECFLGGKVAICTNNLDKIRLIHQSEAEVDVLHFAPEFINVNLDCATIRSPKYEGPCKNHGRPGFQLFLKRSLIYNGILLLDEDSYEKIREKIRGIEYQLSEQSGFEWLCRSRSFLFEIMDILSLYMKKYISDCPQNSLVGEICQFINQNLALTLSLEFLCSHFSVNRTTLSERFQAATGTTISEYIKTKRMERMKYLLAFTELHLSEIGEQVGYSDPTYLSKVFLKNVGLSPSKYRNEKRLSL